MCKRVIRVPIIHESLYEAILGGVTQAGENIRRHGCEWQLAWDKKGVQIYERARYDLTWLQEYVEDYERALYSMLACGMTGADGSLRRRTTHVVRNRGGVYYRRVARPGFGGGGRASRGE